MASLPRRERGVAHLAKILVTCRKARAAEMRASEVSASDRVARKSAAMSAMSAKVMTAAVSAVKTVAMSAAVAVTAAAASAALGNGITSQRHQESKNRNSQRAPNHGTLPAVTPLTLQRE
ncbi:hypothetical protein [Bradyrhizobium lablabi]|uniref:hypothetical protein n=1 Tax=Bradyrhizobium lablabi TaxID=722472 RepID=UPI00201223AB|nr:hypothetical protein [Bradyrhizobium lablabi]